MSTYTGLTNCQKRSGFFGPLNVHYYYWHSCENKLRIKVIESNM